MAAATALSRASGLLRTVALAAALGVSLTSDAYNTANTAPTMVFTLLAGGALSASVVPMLVRAGMRRTDVASVLLGTSVVVGAVVSLSLYLAAPFVTRGLTAGASGREGYDEFADLSTSWLRMFSPQVGLYAVSVVAVAVMTARRRLTLGAAAPVATNLVTIVVLVMYLRVRVEPVSPGNVETSHRLLLGWGTTAAVAAMVAIQLWGAFRTEPELSVRFRLRDPAVRELGRLGRWMVLYVGVNQIGLAAAIAIASSVEGGITAYQWGYMVMQLPYAIIAVSLVSAALPSIAAAVDGAAPIVERPARLTVLLLTPAAAGLVALATPVAFVVVGASGRELVASAIAGFAFSLVPFSLFQLLARTSYALDDTRSPALTNLAVNAANVALAAVCMTLTEAAGPRVMGLALAHAASYVVGCAVLGRRLQQRGAFPAASLLGALPRVVLAASMVAVVLRVGVAWLPSPATRWDAFGLVAAGAAVGALSYLVAARRLGLELSNVSTARQDRPATL